MNEHARRDGRKSLSLPLFFISLFVVSNIYFPRYYLGDVYDRIPFLLAVATAVSHVIVSVFKGERIFQLNLSVILIICFWLFAANATYVQSVNLGRSLECFDVISKAVILFLLIINILNNLRKIQFFLGVLLLCAFGLAYRMVNFPVWDRGRAFIDGTTYGGDPNITSMIIITALPIAVGLMVIYQNKLIRLALLYCMFIMLLGIVEAQSRGGFLAMTTGVMYGIMQIKGIKRRIAVAILIAVLGGGFLVRYVPPGYIERIQGIVDPKSDPTGSAQARSSAMFHTFDYTIRHPISNYGLGNHSYYIADIYGVNPFDEEDIFRGSFLAHNIFLQLGADMGMIPLLVYLLFIFTLFRGLGWVHKRYLQDNKGDASWVIVSKTLRISLVCWLINAFFLPVAYQFFSYYIAGTCVALSSISQFREIQPSAD